MFHVNVPKNMYIHTPDRLIRGKDGKYYVLEDNAERRAGFRTLETQRDETRVPALFSATGTAMRIIRITCCKR